MQTQKKTMGKKVYDLLTYDAYTKILHCYFAYPDQAFGLTELVDAVKISKTSANKAVRQLEKENFLVVEELGRIWRVRANQEHAYFVERKIPFNLQQIYESGILAEVAKYVPGARAVILFGSYRKGDDMPESDLDIAVEVVDDKDTKVVLLGYLKELGYRSKIPVNLHIFSRKTVDINLFVSIANGIVLSGFLEVKP